MSQVIICPGCAWTGTIETLGKYGQCPECGYENGADPNRLLTIDEIEASEGEFNNVLLGPFLHAFLEDREAK